METLVLGPNPLLGAWSGYRGGYLILLLTLVHSPRISYLSPGRVCEADVFLVFQQYVLVLDLGWTGGGRLVNRSRQAPSH